MFGIFKKKKKVPFSDSCQNEWDRRDYLISGEWVNVPKCVDDTPWAEADENVNNKNR